MAVTYIKSGSISPIFYWQNQKGYVMLLETSEFLGNERLKRYMSKWGFMLMSAETLKEAEKLQIKLQEQLKKEQEIELAKDEMMTANHRDQIRQRLEARKNSSNTNPYEKEFIRLYLDWRNHKHDIFKKRFTQQIGHLDALEFDNPNKHIHDLLDK